VRTARVFTVIAAIVAASMPSRAVAQTSRTPIEAGASVSAFRIEPSSDGVSPAVGAWLDLPLSRRVALEMRAELVPADQPVLLQFSSGSTVKLAAGVRAKFISRPRYALVGTFSPELVRVSKTVTGVDQGRDVLGTGTYFSLASSLGVEIYPADRWLARVDVASSVFVASGFELARSEPGPSGGVLVLTQPSRSLISSQLRAGVGLRLGTPVREGSETRVAGRWDVGGHFGYASTTFPVDDSLEPIRDAGLGGFGSYKLADYLHADAAFSFFFDDRRVFTPYSGGRRVLALGGVMLGPRFDRYGVFAKVRVGVNSSSSVLKTILANQTPRVLGRANHLAFESGGVLERDLRRQLFFRLDASVLSTFYRSLSYTFEGQSGTLASPGHTNSLEMGIGVGWRFR
jgi:hypothetical protein